MFTASPSPSSVATSLAALRKLKAEPQRPPGGLNNISPLPINLSAPPTSKITRESTFDVT